MSISRIRIRMAKIRKDVGGLLKGFTDLMNYKHKEIAIFRETRLSALTM